MVVRIDENSFCKFGTINQTVNKMNDQIKKVALQVATFAAIFGLMSFFMDMMEETEEQTTYSITLESLVHAQSETDGEAGGTDGETGGGTGGTPQAGKHTRDVSKTITKYFKWEAGVKIFVSAKTEGAEKSEVTITWSCCCPGGNSCNSNNPGCGSNYCED